MLPAEAEEILRLQRAGQSPFLVSRTFDGEWVEVNDQVLGADIESHKLYVLAVDVLLEQGLVKQIGDNIFDVTYTGRIIADSLIEEDNVAKKVKDSCRITIRGQVYMVTYIGADLGSVDDKVSVDNILQIYGKVYDGHAGIFQVKGDEEQKMFCIILTSLEVPNIGCLKDKQAISKVCLDLLFKRPGMKVVRDELLMNTKTKKNNVLKYPQFNLDSAEGMPTTLEEYVDALDEPRTQILADCERDVLENLIEDRKNRKPVGTTAAEIAASDTKRRFYDIRDHIRETLTDLEYKGFIRTEDNIHYQIEVPRMPDARRVVAGLPSDDLFDAPIPSQLAAYVPESSQEFDAFLCHASEDKNAIVRPFAKAMTEVGLKSWFDEGQVKWGDNLVAKIQYGLSKSRFAIVFISEAFLAKKWPDTELNTALSLEIGGTTFVLPILLGLTHETLQARYPLVSAKVYKEVSYYNQERSVPQEVVKPLVGELKELINNV